MFPVAGVDDLGFQVGLCSAYGGDLFLERVLGAGLGGHRAGFGHAVTFADGAAGDRFPALGRGQLQGHAAGQGDFQRREIQLAEGVVVAQGNKQGVQAAEAAELPLRQFLDPRRRGRVGW